MIRNKKIWLWVLAVVVIGAGIYMAIRAKKTELPPNPQATAQAESSLAVTDQDPENLGVTITSVTLASSGFIVIHEDVGGQPGKIVAQSEILEAGVHLNVNIVTSLTPGQTYWAMVHTDDGNGTFDARYDLPAKDLTGNIIMTRFTVKGIVEGASKG